MKRIALALCLMLHLISCNATEPVAVATGNELTMLDRWNQLMEQAQKAAGAIKDFGQPRMVKRGATPELILRESDIRFNGKLLRLGASIDEWHEILGPKHRDDSSGNTATWDDLGIELVTARQDKKTVIQISIYMNLQPKDPYAGLVTHEADGTPIKPTYDSKPKKPFPGYLELDNVGIDAKSKFWEIRTQIGPSRNLRCGLRDCSHPHGSFSGAADLYMRLNSGDEYGEIYVFSINRQAENLKSPMPTKN
jgi:hypothetical protein